MPFLQDLILYNAGTECPQPFIVWSGLATLGAVLGRKVWTMHGDRFRIYANLYVNMVGTSGSGKSTAQELSRDMIVDNFPNLLISDDFQSAQDILKKMSDDTNVFTWNDKAGLLGEANKIHEYRPFYAIVDELSNFLSTDMKAMTGLLVGIYSRSTFGTGFKNDPNKNQRFRNPYFSMLSCTVPDWMMSNLRIDLFTGGLGRRMIIVHSQKTKKEPDPFIPVGGKQALARAVDHLKAVYHEDFNGQLKRTTEADKWWRLWYNDPTRITQDDPILKQFHETKHIQVLKVAMLLAMCDMPFKWEIDVHHLQGAVKMLDDLEPDILRLTQGIGRNELASIGQQIMDYIVRMGGAASETNIRKFFGRYLKNNEFTDVLQQLIKTEQAFVVSLPDPKTGVPVTFFMIPTFYQGYMKKKNLPFVSLTESAHEIELELKAGQDVPVSSLPAGTQIPVSSNVQSASGTQRK